MQDLQFYHGSILGGLDRILANAKSHVDGRNVTYFTTDRVYALVCCRSRSENFVTMGPAQNGKQHYFERFPNQLKILYQGREGFLYQPLSVETLKNTNGHTWESTVDVSGRPERAYSGYICRNSYGKRNLGRVMIHRYDEIDPKEQKMHAHYMRDHLSDAVYLGVQGAFSISISPPFGIDFPSNRRALSGCLVGGCNLCKGAMETESI